MGMPAEQLRMTVSDYLMREQDSLDKHEYRNGERLLMAGGTIAHSLIVANLNREAGNKLKDKPCRIYDSNLRIRIPRRVLYTYPDASIICGRPEVDPQDRTGQTATNPRVLVEVLSPSTEGYDRGEKFTYYRELPSLEEYVLIAQDAPHVDIYWRREGGEWLFTPVEGRDAVARLRSIGIELALGEIYAGVEFPPPPSPEAQQAAAAPTSGQ